VNGGEGNDEISKLAATFNHMLDRLEKAFRMQKDFITNASHELRTPLTAISGQLEVLLMQERTSEEYTESIASVMEDMRSLNGTANRLLLLAQASTESPSKHFERIRVDEVLWQVRSELLKLNPEYSIQIELDTSLDEEYKLSTNGNLLLMKAAISNLAENACKYSENKTVRINMVFEAELVTISFEDRGIGIHSDDLEIIFEPFHRGRNAGTFKGHGIGLSLVRRIVEMHNGHLLVRSSLSEGSVFILELPALHN
jgi:signal transduction histidine kinase